MHADWHVQCHSMKGEGVTWHQLVGANDDVIRPQCRFTDFHSAWDLHQLLKQSFRCLPPNKLAYRCPPSQKKKTAFNGGF